MPRNVYSEINLHMTWHTKQRAAVIVDAHRTTTSPVFAAEDTADTGCHLSRAGRHPQSRQNAYKQSRTRKGAVKAS